MMPTIRLAKSSKTPSSPFNDRIFESMDIMMMKNAMPRRVASVCLFLLTVLLLLPLGCSKKKQEIPDAQPRPSGVDFQAVWYSPQFEHMYLRQSGERITGIYTYESGGTLEGTVSGNLCKFTWTDPGSKDTATRTMQGRGYFQLVKEDGKLKLKGEWGYEKKRAGAGPWNAEYVRELESGDPVKLEDLEDSNEPRP